MKKKQEVYIVEDNNTGELHLFFCKWDAESYYNGHNSKKPIKINL